jgi:Na+/H+ antiporter NhaC
MCDSTSAPICILIPLNAWGAYVLTLLAAEGLDPLPNLIAAVPLNFYALVAIGLVFVVAVGGWNVGPMKQSEQRAHDGDNGALPEQSAALNELTGEHRAEGDEIPERAINLMLPVITTITMMIVGLWVTGAGLTDAGIERTLLERILAGSGSLSVLWAVSSGVAVSMILAKVQGFYTFPQMAELVIVGFRELIGVATILALALAIGAVCRLLGTGPWVAATVSPWINPVTAAPLVFVASAFIAFSTGTSWGTWAIMFPIAMPVAATLGASVPLMTGAVLGGGVFGDHCSPISDTTVVSSLSAGVDHIEHVVTQIPYALIGGAIATALYFVAGLVLH